MMDPVNLNILSHPETKPTPSSVRVRRNRPEWIRHAAIIWTVVYGVLGLYWSVTGMAAGPVIAVLGFLGVVVLFVGKLRTHRLIRSVSILYAWGAAAFLCFAIPDSRALIAVAYAPICLIGALIGQVPIQTYFDFVTWPVVNQFICLAGGLLWGATALSFQRQSGNACEHGSLRISTGSAARWGRRATCIAMLAPAYYEITRMAWLLGIPLGITHELFQSLRDSGAVWAGAGLALVSLIGTTLTRGLIAPWGETFPRWIPLWAGKRVPPALAIIPAAFVSVMITVTGIQVVRELTLNSIYPNWGATTPLLIWPIWGIALGIATVAYYYRRRNGAEAARQVGE